MNFKTKVAPNNNSDLKPDAIIQIEIKKQANNNRLACRAAFKIAKKLGVTRRQVGETADIINCRLVECQLGLFGYKTNNHTSLPEISSEDSLPQGLKEALRSKLIQQRLKCADCLAIASKFKIPDLTVGELCNAMNIKITECQLKAF
jgi:hypothetical protein